MGLPPGLEDMHRDLEFEFADFLPQDVFYVCPGLRPRTSYELRSRVTAAATLLVRVTAAGATGGDPGLLFCLFIVFCCLGRFSGNRMIDDLRARTDLAC